MKYAIESKSDCVHIEVNFFKSLLCMIANGKMESMYEYIEKLRIEITTHEDGRMFENGLIFSTNTLIFRDEILSLSTVIRVVLCRCTR